MSQPSPVEIEKVAKVASKAFWKIVKDNYPECFTDDLDEQTKIQWEYRTKAIVQRWVNFNYPYPN